VALSDPAVERAAEWAREVQRERRQALRDLRELRRTPRPERAARIERARERYRSRSLAELLVEESRRTVREDAEEARSLAGLAGVVLLWTPGALDQGWCRELMLRAQAWEANALRVCGRLPEADRAFHRARRRQAEGPPSSGSLRAEMASLEASLRIDQGRTPEARKLLAEALRLYRAAGSTAAVFRVLAQRTNLEWREGRLEEAVAAQREVLSLLDAGRDGRMVASGVVNLAHCLVELGRGGEAARLVAGHQGLLQDEGLWPTPNVLMLRGRLALAQGDATAAEGLLLEARAELIGRGDGLRAALASLDLAVLYLEQGRTAELRRMARLMETIFESQDLHEEAMAAVLLFQRAVAAETVTAEAIRACRRLLEGEARRPRREAARPTA
jgi:tetratricopeptide (TPR) repeat protein